VAPGVAEITGPSRVWVYGVHGVLDQFLAERRDRDTEPGLASWRRHGLRNVLGRLGTDVAAGLLTAGVIAIATAVWTLLT
jgi:hypothetical protein